MKKLFLTAIVLISANNLFAQQLCAGKTVDCFDQEAQRWLTFSNADKCEDYHDGFRWRTRTYCSSGGGATPANCQGKSVDCFDAQTQRWKEFMNANTCNDYHNGQSWVTEAYCK